MPELMQRPPALVGPVTWHASRVRKPDAGTTVLVHNPADDEPVWLGWWDDGAGTWMNVEGFELPEVTWWADLPAAPQEPGLAAPRGFRPHVRCTADDAAALVLGSDHMPPEVSQLEVRWVAGTLLKKLGLAALGGSTIEIDLGQGHSLLVQVRAHADAPVPVVEG